MILPDVNVLIYAFNREYPDHRRYRNWLEGVIGGAEPYAVSDLVLSGVVRIATHPRIFSPPSSLADSLEFVEILRSRPNAVVVSPGVRHWPIFLDLCRRSRCRGDLVADAYLAALAIESGGELITTDRDFARFPGLQWHSPLE